MERASESRPVAAIKLTKEILLTLSVRESRFHAFCRLSLSGDQFLKVPLLLTSCPR